MRSTTVKIFIDEAVKQLIRAGTALSEDSGPPRLSWPGAAELEQDTVRLAAFVLDVPVDALALDQKLESDQIARLQELIDQRADGVPIGYLTGFAVLGGVKVTVGPGVFVPRVHSERVLAYGLNAIADVPHPLVVDLCTGTGAIALAFAHARPDATVHAVDIDPLALDYARRNSARQVELGDTPIVIHLADVTAVDLLTDLDGKVDLLYGLPPFMQDGDISWLPAEFVEHQPNQAIFSGPDGLHVTRHIVMAAARLLRPGGVFVLEHGVLHGEEVPEMIQADGSFDNVSEHPDFGGWPLFAAATRAAARSSDVVQADVVQADVVQADVVQADVVQADVVQEGQTW